jgi:phosphoribosylformylglycinamidine cyclo-ligase
VAITYVRSGVSIRKGEDLVAHIKREVRSTYSPEVLGGIGLFGAFYDAKFPKYRSPVLVSSVDGVGTKLLVAQMMNRHDTIGQDLVNHCVNDIAVCGARPLFFMDYFATGKLHNETASEVIGGFIKACRENKCALIGGETAEMPGFYEDNRYDISGTIIGVVERKKMITGSKIRRGDVLIGLPSTGLHTNGYSLARKVLLAKYSIDQKVDELQGVVGDVLLRVHRSYLHVIEAVRRRFEVKGLSHITGGGIVGNTMRILPKRLALKIDWSSWERAPIFGLIQRTGKVPEEDMRRTFNLGVGLVMVVSQRHCDSIVGFIRKGGERCAIIGDVV